MTPQSMICTPPHDMQDDTFYITADGDWDAVNNYRF